MAITVKVRRVGGSLGLVLPKAVADQMALQEGDELYISTTQDSINLTPYDPEFAAALDDAREFMRTHRDAFKALAK